MFETDHGARHGYSGVCEGGPLDGQRILSRFARGFLLVDRPAGKAWLYDLGDGVFRVREELGRQLDEERRRFAAMEDPEFDVVAHPGAGEVT